MKMNLFISISEAWKVDLKGSVTVIISVLLPKIILPRIVAGNYYPMDIQLTIFN